MLVLREVFRQGAWTYEFAQHSRYSCKPMDSLDVLFQEVR